MPHPSAEQIADIVLNRRQVYDLDTDSQIRQAANRLTARALIELLTRLDDQSPDFQSHLSTLLRNLPGEELSSLIGFYAPSNAGPQPDNPGPSTETREHHLRLVFRDEQAASSNSLSFPISTPTTFWAPRGSVTVRCSIFASAFRP